MMDLTRNMCSIFSEPFTTKLGVVAHHDEGFQCPLDSGPNWDWGHNIHPLLCWTCVSTLALLNSCQCPHDSGVSVLMIQGWTGVEMQQSCFALLNRCQCSDDSGVSVLIIQGCPGIGDTAFIFCCFAEQVSVSLLCWTGVNVLALLNRCWPAGTTRPGTTCGSPSPRMPPCPMRCSTSTACTPPAWWPSAAPPRSSRTLFSAWSCWRCCRTRSRRWFWQRAPSSTSSWSGRRWLVRTGSPCWVAAALTGRRAVVPVVGKRRRCSCDVLILSHQGLGLNSWLLG